MTTSDMCAEPDRDHPYQKDGHFFLFVDGGPSGFDLWVCRWCDESCDNPACASYPPCPASLVDRTRCDVIPYCVECGDVTESHLALFGEVCEFLRRKEFPHCHAACGAAADAFPQLRHVRGRFAGGWEHSWLELVDDPLTVIDAYPWACASGPLLVTLKCMSPWLGLYREVPDPPLTHPEVGR